MWSLCVYLPTRKVDICSDHSSFDPIPWQSTQLYIQSTIYIVLVVTQKQSQIMCHIPAGLWSNNLWEIKIHVHYILWMKGSNNNYNNAGVTWHSHRELVLQHSKIKTWKWIYQSLKSWHFTMLLCPNKWQQITHEIWWAYMWGRDHYFDYKTTNVIVVVPKNESNTNGLYSARKRASHIHVSVTALLSFDAFSKITLSLLLTN